MCTQALLMESACTIAEAYPSLGRGGPPPVRVPHSRMAKHRSASEGEDSPDSRGASGQLPGQASVEARRVQNRCFSCVLTCTCMLKEMQCLQQIRASAETSDAGTTPSRCPEQHVPYAAMPRSMYAHYEHIAGNDSEMLQAFSAADLFSTVSAASSHGTVMCTCSYI